MDTSEIAKETSRCGADEQRHVQQPAPFGDVGCKCGRPAHPSIPGKCAGGHPLPGFPGDALVAGERSAWFRTATADAQRDIAGAVLRDAGHETEDAPEALRRLAEGFAQAVLVRDSAFARVAEAGGPMTSSDRARRAFDVWFKATMAVERYARTIGFTRAPKPIASPLDYMAGKVEA